MRFSCPNQCEQLTSGPQNSMIVFPFLFLFLFCLLLDSSLIVSNEVAENRNGFSAVNMINFLSFYSMISSADMDFQRSLLACAAGYNKTSCIVFSFSVL